METAGLTTSSTVSLSHGRWSWTGWGRGGIGWWNEKPRPLLTGFTTPGGLFPKHRENDQPARWNRVLCAAGTLDMGLMYFGLGAPVEGQFWGFYGHAH
jgi:hypothetical protein